MLISIEIAEIGLLQKKAESRNQTLPCFCSEIINTYADCLHILEYKEYEKGYEESAGINLQLANLW